VTEFRLLGPLEAAVDGKPVALPSGKPRALLTRLLLDANRVVPADDLDALWGEAPPPSSRKLVQAYVSQLRKALGAHTIETRPPGYLVRIATDSTDLGRFEKLAQAADEAPDAARRAELLDRALGLWRGPALAEFRDEPFARGPGRRLRELQLAAMEQKLETELELGRHERVVPELEELVEAEPLRERPRRLLMIALYRSGRHAEALARYSEGRRLLVGRLGIEPSPALQTLEQAILRRDPALDHARSAQQRQGCVVCVGAQLHPLVAPLCADGRELLLLELAGSARELGERTAQLDRLRQQLVRDGVEARAAVFTSAEPAEDLARLAADQDADLVVTEPLGAASAAVFAGAPCDVAVAPRPDLEFVADSPVVAPFGGGREEWPALELAAWLARANGLPLRLLGSEGGEERRDASRMLASASLALQRFAEVSAEPVLVAAGAEAILHERASVVVASLPDGELGATREALVKRATVPLLLVRGGVRPSGLDPARTLTRFSWSLTGS
jgi:DNA-binding SARP family transcriptional activator